MKKFLLIIGLLLVSFYSFSQNTGNVNERVKEIRKLYNDIVKNKEDFSNFSIQTPYEEGRILNNKIYYVFNNIKLVTISEGGEFSGGFKEIYFNEGKYFLFTQGGALKVTGVTRQFITDLLKIVIILMKTKK